MNGEHKWKAAVIGTGNVAQKAHLPSYKAGPDVDLVAICGRDAGRTAAVAASFGLQNAFTDVEEMLRTCNPDVVSVCSPNNLHFAHVMPCLEAGCHVLCEKPPAISGAQAKAMQAKAAEKGLVLAYNFQQRQMAEVAFAKKLIAQNFLGKIYHINATFLRRRGIPGWGNFTKKEVQGGGALIDIGVHVLDLALHLLEYPPLKTALGSTYDFIGKAGGKGQLGTWDGESFSVEDACFAHLRFENNCSVSLQTAFALHTEKEKNFSIEIFGDRGGVVFPPLACFRDKDGEAVIDKPVYEQETKVQWKNLQAFFAACEGRPTNICTAQEGVQLQEIVEAVYDSAQGNKAE